MHVIQDSHKHKQEIVNIFLKYHFCTSIIPCAIELVTWSSRQRVCTGEGPAAHAAGPLALSVEEAVLAAVARAVLGHQRDVLVLAVVLLPGKCNS